MGPRALAALGDVAWVERAGALHTHFLLVRAPLAHPRVLHSWNVSLVFQCDWTCLELSGGKVVSVLPNRTSATFARRRGARVAADWVSAGPAPISTAPSPAPEKPRKGKDALLPSSASGVQGHPVILPCHTS